METAGSKLWQDIMAEKLVGAEWHIQEKQPKLAHNEVRSIAKELIYDNYEQEIGRVIKDNPVVSQLAKCNPVAARYLATGLLDFRNNYGKDLLTESRTKIMEEVSIVQADLHQKIDNRMQDYDDKILSLQRELEHSNEECEVSKIEIDLLVSRLEEGESARQRLEDECAMLSSKIILLEEKLQSVHSRGNVQQAYSTSSTNGYSNHMKNENSNN